MGGTGCELFHSSTPTVKGHFDNFIVYLLALDFVLVSKHKLVVKLHLKKDFHMEVHRIQFVIVSVTFFFSVVVCS